MKRLLSALLSFALLLSLTACAQLSRPGSSVLESSQAESSAENLVSEQATPAPADTAEIADTAEESNSTYPIKEPVYHDWDGSGTLYPYATIASPGVGEAFALEQGLLIPAQSYLNYLDYASGQLVKFCFRPNCQHHGSDCGALVSNSSRWCFVANEKFYYLDAAHATTAYNEDLEGYAGQVGLYVSSLNRSNEKKIATLPISSISGEVFASLVLYGNSAFLFHGLARRDTMVVQDETAEDTYACVYMTEIDLRSDKVVNSQIIFTGYQANAVPECAYGGGIYLHTNMVEKPYPVSYVRSLDGTYTVGGEELSREEYEQYYDQFVAEPFIEKYLRYDIVTGELEERTDAFPDEYGGPRIEIMVGEVSQGIKPQDIVRDWCIVIEDENWQAYNLKTGEARLLFEDWRKDGADWWGEKAVPNSNKIRMTYAVDNVSTIMVIDLDTGEKTVDRCHLNDGQHDIILTGVYGQNEDVMYVRGALLEESTAYGTMIYLRVDLTNGFEANEWEQFTLV